MSLRREPSRGLPLAALTGLAVLAGLGLAAWLALPRVQSVSPAAEAQNVSRRAPVRLTFTREMDAASIESALSLEPPQPGTFAWQGAALTFTPADPWPADAIVTVRLAGGRSQLGLPLLDRREWSFHVGLDRLAYLAGSPPNLWTISIGEEAAPQPITREAWGVGEFTLTPDGAAAIYSGLRADGGADLRQINLDGTGAADRLLCPGEGCRQPTISADGARVAYERRSGDDGATTTSVHVLTLATGLDAPAGDPTSQARAPRWAPDGRLSFYDATRQAITVQDLGSGAVTYIPVASGEMGTWAPGAAFLVYPEIFLLEAPEPPGGGQADDPPTFYSHLLRVEVATNSIQNLSGNVIVEDASPAYSPLGEWIAFAHKDHAPVAWTPGRQLWRMRADGSQARPLTNDPIYHHSAFAWSADGAWIAYMRVNATDLAEPPEIWLIRSDGSGARRLVAGGYAPAWVP